MSLAATCGWTLLRSLGIALLAIPICQALCRLIFSTSDRSRTLIWTILLAPFFFPDLAVGYAYANFSLSLVHYPHWNELLYAALLTAKMIPVGTVAIWFSPPAPLSAEALHCRRLAFHSCDRTAHRILESAGYWIRGPLRAIFPAISLIFLLACQDFEMASLMGTTAWTVWLFDAQVGGLLLADSLYYALIPFCCELVVLLPILSLAWKSRSLVATPHQHRTVLSPLSRLGLGIYLLGACLGICGIPSVIIGRGTLEGLLSLAHNAPQATGLLQEIITGGILAVISSLGALGVAAWGLSPARKGSGSRLLVALLATPGLFGALILSLLLLGIFQTQLLNPLYTSSLPIPLILALFLFLLPRAVLLEFLLSATQPRDSVHVGQLLQQSPHAVHQRQARELKWQLQYRRHFWAAALLGYWGYLDLTATSLLAPPGIVSAPMRLYNLTHYGRNAILSAMTCATLVAPLLLIALALVLRRELARRLDI